MGEYLIALSVVVHVVRAVTVAVAVALADFYVFGCVGVYLVPEGKHTLCDDYDVSALSCRMDILAYFWFGSTCCFADTGASRSTNARNKLLCDDAVHDVVVVAVAIFERPFWGFSKAFTRRHLVRTDRADSLMEWDSLMLCQESQGKEPEGRP